MKIAIIADSLDNQSAGVHTYTSQLIQALIKYDTDNEYLIIREKKDHNLPLEQVAIPNIRLPIGFASLRLFLIIPLILRFKKVDAVFETAHFGPFNLPKRIKRITMIHDLTPLLLSEHHRFHSQFLQRIFLKPILKKANLILTNSLHTSKDLVRVFPFTKHKNKVILLGRDRDFQSISSRRYLEKTSITAPYFLNVGTIEPRKNLIVLLEAYRQFRENSTEKVKLLIVGKDGWKTEAFYAKLKNHPFRDDILLTGYVTKLELTELYSHALALIYPSIYEGFGLPILEALSCGTQVICSNNSSLPEVGGDVAFYFDAEDEIELEMQMSKVFQNFNDGYNASKAFLKQANKFSWENYVIAFKEALMGDYIKKPELSSKNRPLVSIVMATFNRAKDLESTLANIFDQDYDPIELVVINDGSADDTSSVLLSCQSKYNFILIENPKNLGLQKSLNIGIQRSSGKYIARIDDHDKWLRTDKITKQVSFLEANPEIGLLGTGYKMGDQNMLNPLTDTTIRNQILMRSPFCHVSVLMAKSILDQIGGYDETLSYSEDWDLWLRIGKHAKLANLPDITVAVQDEDLSLSQDYFLRQLPINRQIVKRYYKDYPNKIKAYVYHHFIKYFFTLFPLNGTVHKFMNRVFLSYFALSSKKELH